MIKDILDIGLTILLGLSLLILLLVLRRARRADYHDIEASEINPDLAAGEELLEDAMKEYRDVSPSDRADRDATL